MEHAYWLDKWSRQEIGFHEADVNVYLKRHWQDSMPTNGRVLVPLCGKSLDMLWLVGLGLEVVGVELSEIAAKDFFESASLDYSVKSHETLDARCYCSGPVSIWAGDFFAFQPDDLGQFQSVYDRAALVALPAELRVRYAQHLRQFMSDDSELLLVTMEYDQAEMSGPPFNVSETELTALYAGGSRKLLERNDAALESNPKFTARGVTQLAECVWHLRWT